MAMNLNQFKITNRAGLVMNPAANVIQCQVLPTLATTSYLSAGQVVAFGTDSGSTPIVRAVANAGGCGIGIIVYNMKTDKYYARYICGVALDGSIITCNADVAMTRGNIVGWGSGGVRPIANTSFGIGITLDNATAANDIVRVLIQTGISGTGGLSWQS